MLDTLSDRPDNIQTILFHTDCHVNIRPLSLLDLFLSLQDPPAARVWIK